MVEHVSVIVNPAAGRGRALKMIPRIAETFAAVGVIDVRLTSKKGDEAGLTRYAIERGATTIVVVGGDGTTTHVANTILKSTANVRLAVIPAGTGNDFAKVLGTDKCTMSQVARNAVEHGNIRVDVGQVEDRYFLNSCGFGFDVAVLESTLRTPLLRGNLLYLYAALRQLIGFRGIELAYSARTEKHLLLVIANTEYFGGMFRIAPGARVDDGELDLVGIVDVPIRRRVPMLAAARKGEHFRYEECVMERAKSFNLTFPFPPAYQTDGELHRAASSSLTVTSCAAALRVVTAQGNA
jgi:diacylglycerol kinase (ATP)